MSDSSRSFIRTNIILIIIIKLNYFVISFTFLFLLCIFDTFFVRSILYRFISKIGLFRLMNVIILWFIIIVRTINDYYFIIINILTSYLFKIRRLLFILSLLIILLIYFLRRGHHWISVFILFFNVLQLICLTFKFWFKMLELL